MFISDMHTLFQKIITRFFESAEARERAYRDAYLAEATDLIDLEFRMKKLDQWERRPDGMLH